MLLALAIGALAAVLPAGPAAAHAVLVSADPPNGATVARAPDLVLLRFSEDIAARFSAATLLDGAGRAVAGAHLAADRGGPRLLALRLPALPEATYAVSWRVLTEDDGHTTGGVTVFTVGKPSRSPGGQAGTGARTPPQDVLRRWLALCLLAGLIGGLAFAGLVLRPAGFEAANPGIRRRILMLAAGSGAAAAVLGGLDLAVHATRTGSAWGLLTAARWGHLWLVHEAALVGLAVLALRRRQGRSVRAATGGLVLALVVVEGLGSHAMAVGPGRAVAVAAVAAHALAASVWLGGVSALGLMAVRREPMLGTAVARFTALAVAAMGLVVATGLYSAGREVDSWSRLVDTRYGQTLLLKAALLLAVGVLALANAGRIDLAPEPAGAGAPARRPMLIVECAAGAVLLLLAGVLGETPPAHRVAAPDTAAATAVTRTASVADLLVSVAVTPNRPGVNGFTVLATSSRRPPPAPVDAVTLLLADGARVPLRAVEPGRYLGTASLSAAGPTRATVEIQRGDGRLTTAVGWPVPPAAAPPAPAPPDGLPTATAVAAALVLGVLVLGLLALAGWRLRLRGRRPASAERPAGVRIPEGIT